MLTEKLVLPETMETERVIAFRRCHLFDREKFNILDKHRPFLRKYLLWLDCTQTLADITRQCDEFRSLWEEGKDYSFDLTDKQQHFIGCISVYNIDYTNHGAEIGYWLAPEATGYGYISEILAALEKQLWEKEIVRIVIHCDAENQRSANVARRNGYRLEAVLKKAICVYGTFCDRLQFVKINPNYRM